MTPDDLIAHDNTPGWFDPSAWHMLIESTTALPVLIKGPTRTQIDSEFAIIQFTYVNTSSVDHDVAKVATFYWDATAGRPVLVVDLNTPFVIKAGTSFTVDRMVARLDLEAAL